MIFKSIYFREPSCLPRLPSNEVYLGSEAYWGDKGFLHIISRSDAVSAVKFILFLPFFFPQKRNGMSNVFYNMFYNIIFIAVLAGSARSKFLAVTQWAQCVYCFFPQWRDSRRSVSFIVLFIIIFFAISASWREIFSL